MSSLSPADALYRDLPAALTVHPHQVDLLEDRLLMLRLSEETLRDASFLDQRVLTRGADGAWFAWQQVAERMGNAATGTTAHYVFHIGHCGSTLISRLLAELGVTPLREPLPLRTLAEMLPDLGQPYSRWSRDTFETRLALLCNLFDRGAGPRAVKATSFCNDLAPLILAGNQAVRATIVYARPRAYIANMLAGSNSRLDLSSVAPLRLRRLDARTGGGLGCLHEMSPGIVAGMSWASEMSALAATFDGSDGARVLAVDFDDFLRDVRGSLGRLARHIVPGTQDDLIAAAAASPALTRYSKAPEHVYDAGLRDSVLADAERRWSEDIRAGLAWCERAATRWPVVARALERFDAR